jgi:hypothetical protein
MRYIDDIEQVRRRVATEAWATRLLDNARAEADSWATRFSDSPTRVSGWGHDYFCPSCSSRLVFDLDKPHEHVCSACGRVNAEEKHHAVWVATYRGRLAAALFSTALLYSLEGGEQHLRFVERALLFYADRYDEFAVHGGWVAKGRIMWQSLDEAVFAISLLKTVELLGDAMGPATMDRLHRGLFQPLALFVAGQPEHLLNIRLWIRSAVTIAGLVFGDRELETLGMDGAGGVRDLLAQAVTADHLWIEGSLHYHFYALNALTELCHFAAIHGRRQPAIDAIARGMYRVPLDLAYRDLSNPNDGWPDIGVPTYLVQYELSQKLFPEPQCAGVLTRILRDPSRRTLSTLLFVPPATVEGADQADLHERSLHLPAMNFVKLCSGKLSVFFRYGFRTRAHAHFDRMALEIHGFSPDPSNVGYGSALHGTWYMTTVAHNTVVVDGRNQATFHPGECLQFDESQVRARASEVYPGVSFERELRLAEDGLQDRFRCESREEHTYDWLFHGRGALETTAVWEPTEIGFSENGYQHLSEVRRANAIPEHDAPALFTWRLPHGRELRLDIDLGEVPAAEIYRFQSIDNPPTARRAGLLVRAHGRVAEFRATFAVRAGYRAMTYSQGPESLMLST